MLTNGSPLTTVPRHRCRGGRASERAGAFSASSYRCARQAVGASARVFESRAQHSLPSTTSWAQANCARRLRLALRTAVPCRLTNLKRSRWLAQHAAKLHSRSRPDSAPGEACQLRTSIFAATAIVPVGTHHLAALCLFALLRPASPIQHRTRLQTLPGIPCTLRHSLAHSPLRLEHHASHCTTVRTSNNVPHCAPRHHPAVPRSTALVRRSAPARLTRTHDTLVVVVCTRTLHPLTGTCIDAHRLPKPQS